MKIIIDRSKKLSEIQMQFQQRFPFLKIEFYMKAHAAGEGSTKASTLNTALRIEEVQPKTATGIITINGLMRVNDLESAFADTFGLSAQVFRKSGRVWLQTTVTDTWTLEAQNQKAIENDESINEDTIDAMDRMELE